MRLTLWLLASIALMTGGCVLPCSNGACSSSGEPRYVSPASRFFSTEKLIPQQSSCASGNCQPKPYFTFSKYLPLMDQWTSKSTARHCADRHLLRQQFQCRKWISKHYKAGFRDAFMDIANGESGEVPAVPPPKYWNTHYRTESGKRCVELYFDGYRAGSALAAAELTTMKTIGASYDWSIQKPKAPCASPGACNPGVGDFAPGGAGQAMPFQYQMGMPQAGCQSCQVGSMSAQQPSVFPTNPQPSASGIGPANTYPSPGNYGLAPIPEQNYGQQQSPYQNSPEQSGPGYFGQGQYGPGQYQPGAGPPSQPAQEYQVPGLPAPGYAAPSGAPVSLPLPQNRPSAQNQIPQPNPGLSGAASQQQGGALTPGFSGNLPGQVWPGKLGPPDQFQSDPPAWQYPPPQR
jgi:hypothetical protein